MISPRRICIFCFALTLSGAMLRGTPATQPTTLPAGTRVTLKLNHVPALDAFKQLFAQGKLNPEILEMPWEAREMDGIDVSINLEDQPFNVALLELCKQAGFEPAPGGRFFNLFPLRPRLASTVQSGAATTSSTQPANADRQSSRRRKSWINAPRMICGPFLVVMEESWRRNWIDLRDANPSPQRELIFQLMVMRDPAVRVMSDSLVLDDLIDESGHSLMQNVQNGHEFTAAQPSRTGTLIRRFIVRLSPPPLAAGKISVLKAHLHVLAVVRTKSVELVHDGKAIGGQRSAGEVQFSIGALKQHGMLSELPFEVYRAANEPNPGSWNMTRAIAANDGFQAIDETGRPLTVSANVYRIINDQKLGGSLMFFPRFHRNGAAPPKLKNVVWQVPQELQEFDVPVEFRDLELP